MRDVSGCVINEISHIGLNLSLPFDRPFSFSNPRASSVFHCGCNHSATISDATGPIPDVTSAIRSLTVNIRIRGRIRPIQHSLDATTKGQSVPNKNRNENESGLLKVSKRLKLRPMQFEVFFFFQIFKYDKRDTLYFQIFNLRKFCVHWRWLENAFHLRSCHFYYTSPIIRTFCMIDRGVYFQIFKNSVSIDD